MTEVQQSGSFVEHLAQLPYSITGKVLFELDTRNPFAPRKLLVGDESVELSRDTSKAIMRERAAREILAQKATALKR